MTNAIRNWWVRLGVLSVLTLVVGLVIGLVIAPDGGADASFSGPVTITSGSTVGARAYLPTELPLTVADARAVGWDGTNLCFSGRGRYFQKTPGGQGDPYLLMFDSADELRGIYIVSPHEMPAPPWKFEPGLSPGGRTVIDIDHWGLFVYFQPVETRDQGTDTDARGFKSVKLGAAGVCE